MNTEIERKFLVIREEWDKITTKPIPLAIRQGYLSVDPLKTVRVRTTNNEAELCIKIKIHPVGCLEFEYDIPYEDAELLLDASIGSLVKSRYEFLYKNRLWEVDEFYDLNTGLLMAEIEYRSQQDYEQNYNVELPPWIGEEVTDDKRYTNANLVVNPYNNWK